jgi:hypothetical protein
MTSLKCMGSLTAKGQDFDRLVIALRRGGYGVEAVTPSKVNKGHK